MMSMMTEIQEDTKKWKCNSCQDPNDTFHRNRTNNPKFYVEPQKPLKAKAILSKNKPKGTLPDFKLYHKVIVIKKVMIVA